jgi:hypothetical protein
VKDNANGTAPGIVLSFRLYRYGHHGKGSLKQTRVFCRDSFLHMLQCCAVVVHIHWYPMVQNFENAPCDSGCHQQCL